MANSTFPSFPASGAARGDFQRYSSAFPDPFFDYASTQMPRNLYDVMRWCFVPGSLVQMASGTLKAVERVVVADVVTNRHGKPGNVVRISARPWNDTIVALATSDGSAIPIKSIPDHEHFVVRTKQGKPSRCLTELKPERIQKLRAGDIRVGDYLVAPQPQLGAIEAPTVDPYVAGYYLGDGWTCQRYASKGPRGNREWYDTGDRYATRLIVDRPAVAARLQKSRPLLHRAIEYNKATVYADCDPALTVELESLCGRGAAGKQLSAAAYGWNTDQVFQFVAGYIDADGHAILKDGRLSACAISSVNKALLLQVRRLCNAAGLTPTLGKRVMGGGGVCPEAREGYLLYFNWYNMQSLHAHSEKLREHALVAPLKGRTLSVYIRGGLIYRRVRQISEEFYAGLVHNFEVAGEHSYIVNGCATSNCEFYWITNGIYRTACQRIVRYFLTKVELEDEDADDDERKKYTEFLEKQVKIIDLLATIGDDFMCYGNSFTSIHIPFRRYLRCPHCKNEYSLKWLTYKFQDWEFHATCPKCHRSSKFERVDRRSVEQDRIKVIRWSPHEIRLLYHPISHEMTYYWIPPADFKREIRRGNPFYIATTPWEIIEAVKKNEWFKFNPGIIYHVKEETVAGIRNNGWGIPRVMANFKQAWYVQVLKRYNEAIGLDYIIPFRVITPGKNSGSGEVDPMLHANLGQFLGRVMGMVQKHRRDPTQWNALPFPIEYQALGAEGKDLAPTELIEAGVDELLNSMGFPAELFKGSIQVQAAPMALRLFERTWTHLVSALNGWINWFFEQITAVLNWEEISGRLQPVTLAEDMERRQILLQLAAGQQISKQTAYAPFGIEWPEEVRRMFEEEKSYQEQSKRFQQEQARAQNMEATFETAEAQQQMGGGMPGAMPGAAPGAMPGAMPAEGGAPAAGGMPAPGGLPTSSGAGTTPADMMANAEQIALQMLGMPYEARKSELLNLKKSDETLHALVIQKMQDIRQKAKQQGGFQALQQMTGAQTG